MLIRCRRQNRRWILVSLLLLPCFVWLNIKWLAWRRPQQLHSHQLHEAPSLKKLGVLAPGHGTAHGVQQEQVLAAFRHCWQAYTKFAWGKDELDAVGKRAGKEKLGMATTLMGSMSTALAMNHTQYFYAMDDWMDNHLKFDSNIDANIYQMTSQVLSSMVSIHQLTGFQKPMEEAMTLMEEMLPAFAKTSDDHYTFPRKYFNMATKTATGDVISVSEMATMTLEMAILANCTKNEKVHHLAKDLKTEFLKFARHGLLPTFYNLTSGQFLQPEKIEINADTVRFYDTLLKLWLLQESRGPDHRSESYQLFRKSIDDIAHRLIVAGTVKSNDHVYLAYEDSGKLVHVMRHGGCALPGILALHYQHRRHRSETSQFSEKMLTLAENLMRTCMRFYLSTRSGLSPQKVVYNPKTDILKDPSTEDYNGLWPETVESLYILHQVTRHSKYQRMGWRVFQNLRKSAFMPNVCFTQTVNLNLKHTEKLARTPPYFFSATLKYLYLLYNEKPVFDLRHWLFSASGHIFRI